MIEDIKKLLPKLVEKKQDVLQTLKIALEDDMLVGIDQKHISHFNSLSKAQIHLENIIEYYGKD